MTFDLEIIRNDFPILKNGIYANHAAVSPIPLSVKSAMLERLELHMYSAGSAWDDAMPIYDEGRRLAAELVNCRPDQIAWIHNTSHGISLIANGIDWRPGDNVIVPDREFPSNYFAWKQLAKLGVELRHVPSINGKTLPKEVAKLIDQHTRAVTLSQVQYYNGFHCDIPSIGNICQQHNALLVVDGTQSIGAINLDVTHAHVDVLVVSAHKWMMGPLGIGFMALSDRALQEVAVTSVGWLSFSDPFDFAQEKDLLPGANRFEPGTENGAGIYGLVARLRSISTIGSDVIEQRIIALTDQFCAGLKRLGYTVTSHRGEGEKSAIVTFKHPKIESQLLLDRLNQANVSVSLRAGGIRFSPHYYNSEEEIKTVLSILKTP